MSRVYPVKCIVSARLLHSVYWLSFCCVAAYWINVVTWASVYSAIVFAAADCWSCVQYQYWNSWLDTARMGKQHWRSVVYICHHVYKTSHHRIRMYKNMKCLHTHTWRQQNLLKCIYLIFWWFVLEKKVYKTEEILKLLIPWCRTQRSSQPMKQTGC